MSHIPNLSDCNFSGSVGRDFHARLEPSGHEAPKGKKLLAICHSYNNFQKDTTEGLSEYFREVNVLVRTNRIAEIGHSLHLPQLERFKRTYKFDLLSRPHNINVYPTPLWYLPGDRAYKSLGDKHLNDVKHIMKKKNIQFDIIHSHFTWSAGYVGAKLKEEYGVPFVVTGHGYDIYSLPFKDDEWREKIKWVLNTADRIITVSKSNLAFIKKLDISTPVTIIPNGFRSDLFYPRSSSECRKFLNLPQEKKIIVTVGNLAPIKGQRFLIDAVKEITQQRKDVLCVIIGTGRLHKALEKQIRLFGLEEYILLVGGKPHHEIPTWINACDLFVLPSLNEGNPTVMFEALGCGKPFVGTKVGGMPEIINSHNYGLLVEPASPDSLAEEILVALDREWDSEAIIRYAERYTWDTIVKEIIDVYRQVLG